MLRVLLIGIWCSEHEDGNDFGLRNTGRHKLIDGNITVNSDIKNVMALDGVGSSQRTIYKLLYIGPCIIVTIEK